MVLGCFYTKLCKIRPSLWYCLDCPRSSCCSLHQNLAFFAKAYTSSHCKRRKAKKAKEAIQVIILKIKHDGMKRQLILFPLGFAIIWIPPSINRAQEAYGKPLFALVFLESMWLPLQGFINWIFYGLTSNVLKKTHSEEKKPILGVEERKELRDVSERLHASLLKAAESSDGSLILVSH